MGCNHYMLYIGKSVPVLITVLDMTENTPCFSHIPLAYIIEKVFPTGNSRLTENISLWLVIRMVMKELIFLCNGHFFDQMLTSGCR